MTHRSNMLDVAIVGGGPIGLELAAAMQRLGITYEVFEAYQVGHTISWWAPQTRWFSSNDRISIAGVPLESTDQTKATREQYLAYLRSVVRQFGLNVSVYTRVTGMSGSFEEGFTLTLQSPTAVRSAKCRNIVLAVGGTDKPKRLNVQGEELPHVDSYFREPHCYFNRNVLIIGGRNSAVEAALRANQCGAKVSLSYRRECLPKESIKYWLLPEIEGLIRSEKIKAYFNTLPLRIESDRVVLANSHAVPKTDDCLQKEGASDEIEVLADNVLSLIGYEQDKTLWKLCGVNLVGESKRPEFDPETMMTNVSGIYVAGTAVAGTQSSKYRVFVENCHDHIPIIARAITGKSVTDSLSLQRRAPEFESQIEAMPES